MRKEKEGGKGSGEGAKLPGFVRKSPVCGASRIRDGKGKMEEDGGSDIRASEEFRVHGVARGVKISQPFPARFFLPRGCFVRPENSRYNLGLVGHRLR